MLMDSKILDEITNSIKTKLGDDNVALIGDDLGMLITENNKSVNTINDLNDEVKNLKSKNEILTSFFLKLTKISFLPQN